VVTICDSCGWSLEWELVEEYEDECGRRWEVYQCPRCGERKQYAVS
jgi:predicted RNA-binding Zn-ribbon protein involved in translation (DUF1610 family)